MANKYPAVIMDTASYHIPTTLPASVAITGNSVQNNHIGHDLQIVGIQTKQPPAKAGGFEIRTESPDTHRLNDAS